MCTRDGRTRPGQLNGYIQILVFAVAGTALGDGIGVAWSTIGLLTGVWVVAPLVAGGLGFVLTGILDRVPAVRRELRPEPAITPTQYDERRLRPGAGGPLALGLVAVGAAASFVMGSNDVANATGSLVATVSSRH